MKRFLVFAGECYYPQGGWDDFKGSYEHELEAKQTAEGHAQGYRWAHVVDTQSEQIIATYAEGKAAL